MSTVSDLHEAARNSYAHPHFVYLREVRDATGFDAIRTADAIAIGMYRSHGRTIHGFEMKVSRQDWQKELKQPGKAESLLRYCDTWALIASAESIVHAGELPKAWGFGIPHRRRSNVDLKIQWIVKPPQLKPQHYTPEFLTALIAAARKEPIRDMQATINAARAEGEQSAARAIKREQERADRLNKIISDFSRLSGVYLSQYTTDPDVQASAEAFRRFTEAQTMADHTPERLRGLTARR